MLRESEEGIGPYPPRRAGSGEVSQLRVAWEKSAEIVVVDRNEP